MSLKHAWHKKESPPTSLERHQFRCNPIMEYATISRVVVGTAKEAIKGLRKQKIDLTLLDLQLPDASSTSYHK